MANREGLLSSETSPEEFPNPFIPFSSLDEEFFLNVNSSKGRSVENYRARGIINARSANSLSDGFLRPVYSILHAYGMLIFIFRGRLL